MKPFFKTLLILYSVVNVISATEIQYYEFNPLDYDGNEDKYSVIVPKIESDDGEGNIVYEKALSQATTNDGNKTPVFTYTTRQTTTNRTNYKVLVQNNNIIPSWNQKYSDNISLFEFDNNNMPVVMKALKSDFVTPYTINGKEVFRQKIKMQYNQYDNNSNYSDVKLQFDVNNGDPKFIAGKQAANPWVTSTLYYAKDDGTIVTSEDIDTKPILIQQWYPDNDDSYNTKESLAYSAGIPIITKALFSDGSDYKVDGIQIYRQITVYENNFKFDNEGNPIFLTDPNTLVPSFDGTEEADGYNIGELILKNGNKKCVTGIVQWYDLNNYILEYIIRLNPSSSDINPTQNINFIVKDNYTLSNNLSCNNCTATLFIPKNITLTMKNAIISNNQMFNFLCLGKLVDLENIQTCFNQNGGKGNFIFAPESIVAIGSTTSDVWFQGNSKFIVPIFYPTLLDEQQFVFDDQHITSDGNNVTAITSTNVHTFQENGVLYLNRFNKDDTEAAKKLKGIIQYGTNIVFPGFLGTDSDYGFDDVYIDTQHFTRNTFFPNLLWFVALNGEHSKGQIIPTSMDDPDYRGNQYFFDSYNYRYEDVYKSEPIWKYYNENGEVLALDENGTYVGTNKNQFVDYDEKFLNVSIPDERILKLISTTSFASNQTTYNISTNSNSKSCYWDTNTIQACFEDGALYYNNNTITGILKNLPATLNVGLTNENTDDKENERVSTSPSITTITLSGDNQYFYGIYTVPANTPINPTTINLNNENALLKMEQLDEYGNIKYKISDTPSSGVDLSSLTYNIMTNINWDLNRTGENLVSGNTVVLDMNLTNENGAFITFKDNTGEIQEVTFNGNNTRYTMDGGNNYDLTNRGYFIPSTSQTSVVFKDDDAIVKILTGQNTLYTSIDTIHVDASNFSGFILTKDIRQSGGMITKITNGSTKYVKHSDKWYLSTDDARANDLSSIINDKYFYTVGDLPDLDKRDTVNEMRQLNYKYNQYNEDGNVHYINTEVSNEQDKVNELFYNDEDGRNNMPPIINLGLINDGNITIVNSSNNNTLVKLSGLNNGIRTIDEDEKLQCKVEYNELKNSILVQTINSADKIPLGKPYTGNIVVPNKITDITFDYNSFVPNIKIFKNSSNNGVTDDFTGNYKFIANNTIQRYDVNNGLQQIDDNIDYPITEEPLSLNLNTVTVSGKQVQGHDIVAHVTLNKANVKASNFTVSKGSVVNLTNNSHLSVKTNNNS